MSYINQSDFSLFWDGVSGEHEAVQKRSSLTHAKVAVAQYWPFLSRATSEKDFENRLSLTQDRIAAIVPAETYDDVISSLRDDFSRLAGGKGENPFAKDDDDNNDEADNDDKDSKSSKSDDDSDDDSDDGSDDDSDSDDDSKDSKSDDDSDDDDDDDDDKPDFLKSKKATNYRPDPTAGWRYHPGYEQLRQPVNNGDLQDGDGFVADLAQGEGRSNEVIEQRQLTPGVWTQHDGMPERPMPQGVQRGYMPVNAKFDKQGFLIESATEGVACNDGNCKQYHWSTSGTRYGLPSDHKNGNVENVGRKPIVARFDKQGFLIESAEGRGVDPLQDPVPGQPQRHNPFYFQDGSNVGGNDGFPSDPGPEPHMNNMDEIYGDVAPQSSSGSTTGQVDGQGYSREGSRLGFNRAAASYVNTPEPGHHERMTCPRCGGDGGEPGENFGDHGWHPCYHCGTSGSVNAHDEWANHEYDRGATHGAQGMAPEEDASPDYLEGHKKSFEENRFDHHPSHYRVKRDGQEDYHSPAAQQSYKADEEDGWGYGEYHFPYRQASRYDAEGYLVESPNFT